MKSARALRILFLALILPGCTESDARKTLDPRAAFEQLEPDMEMEEVRTMMGNPQAEGDEQVVAKAWLSQLLRFGGGNTAVPPAFSNTNRAKVKNEPGDVCWVYEAPAAIMCLTFRQGKLI